MSSVYCRGGIKLVFDVADHYVQNGTHTYLPCFSITPQKNQTGNLRSQKKKVLKTRTTVCTGVKKCSYKFFTSKCVSAQSKVSSNLYKELSHE